MEPYNIPKLPQSYKKGPHDPIFKPIYLIVSHLQKPDEFFLHEMALMVPGD